MTSLFERIGGETAVDQAVDIFYDKVIEDERINLFFRDLDMAAQANKQKAFLTMAFGGPNHYQGLDMRQSHSHLGLTEEHFYAVVEHLGSTLTDLEVSEQDIQAVVTIAESVKADVLCL